VRQQVQVTGPDALLVFDEGGITGHPDHCQAAAALSAAARDDLTVIAWAIPDHVAETLNAEFATTFTGRPAARIDLTISVDRFAQLRAIACHASQSTHNPVLWRRLELQGDTEHLRYLRRVHS
jgi:LmbE family N-acetylglucosaminyl deacetylase